MPFVVKKVFAVDSNILSCGYRERSEEIFFVYDKTAEIALSLRSLQNPTEELLMIISPRALCLGGKTALLQSSLR